MIVRELLTRLGFSMDEAKLKHYEQRAEAVADGFGKINGLFTLAMGALVGVATAGVTRINDEWDQMEARVGLVTKSAQEQEQVLQSVYDIANRTRQEYEASGDMYFKLARGTKEFGASQQDILDVVETVNEALVVGGASASEAKATILQLGQALSSGRLQGDELRSLDENASVLMQEVAKAYGVTIGQLKQLGADGELTSEGVFKAILGAKSVMDEQFAKMPLTVGQAATVAGNRFGRFINNIGKETGAFKSIAWSIVNVTAKMEAGINRVVRAAGGWNRVFKIAGIVIAALLGGFMAFKWAAIVSGINSISRAMMMLARNPATLAIIALLLALEDLYTWMEGGDSLIGEWLGPWELYKDRVMQIWDDIGARVELFWGYLTAAGQWAFNVLKTLLIFFFRLLTGDGAGAAAALESLIQQLINGLIAWVKTVLPAVWPMLKAIGTVFIAVIGYMLSYGWQLLTTFGSMLFSLFLSLVTAIFSAIGQTASGVLAGLVAMLLALIVSLGIGIKDGAAAFVATFAAAISSVETFFTNLGTWAIGIIQNIGSAIGQYILSKMGTVGKFIGNLAGINLSSAVNPGAMAQTNTTSHQVTVNVETPPGTTASQSEYLQRSAKLSYDGVYNTLDYAGG